MWCRFKKAGIFFDRQLKKSAAFRVKRFYCSTMKRVDENPSPPLDLERHILPLSCSSSKDSFFACQKKTDYHHGLLLLLASCRLNRESSLGRKSMSGLLKLQFPILLITKHFKKVLCWKKKPFFLQNRVLFHCSQKGVLCCI